MNIRNRINRNERKVIGLCKRIYTIANQLGMSHEEVHLAAGGVKSLKDVRIKDLLELTNTLQRKLDLQNKSGTDNTTFVRQYPKSGEMKVIPGGGTGATAGDGGFRITDAQLGEIERLRQKAFNNPDGFFTWLRDKFGVDEPRWLTRMKAGSVIHALKDMEAFYAGKN